MSVRPASARLTPAPGAPPPRRANDSADEMIRSLMKDVRDLQKRLGQTEDSVKRLIELRARDHRAREATFTGRFVAMGGAFADEKKSAYEVRIGVLNDDYLATPGHLADDSDAEYATQLVTVRFTEARPLHRINYDGELVDKASDYTEHAGNEYEIKRSARSYMLEHTGWQPMFPAGKEPDSVAPYALF